MERRATFFLADAQVELTRADIQLTRTALQLTRAATCEIALSLDRLCVPTMARDFVFRARDIAIAAAPSLTAT